MGMFDWIGDLTSRSARNRAANSLKENKSLWQGFDANLDAHEAEDAFGGDSAAARANRDAIAQFGQIADAKGMDEGAQAALHQAQLSNAMHARGATDAALERARAAGRLNGGRALSAQVQAQQNATNANAMAGAQAVADARNRAMNALGAQGQMAGQALNATNAMNQYNAAQRQGAAQQTIQNQAMRTRGISDANNALSDFNMGRVQEAKNTANGLGEGLVNAATSAFTMGLGGMADGGLIDGEAQVPGDSEKNDTVPALLSPGEMVIPRTVVQDGPEDIEEFARRILRREY